MKRKIYCFLLSIFVTVPLFAQNIGEGKISGTAYFDYFYNAARPPQINDLPNTALGGEKDLNGFMFRRIYLTYDHTISKSFSGRFRVEADEVELTSNGKIGVFVKDAYLKWKNIFDGSDIYLGIQPGPAFAVSEDNWGYRSLEKTILDLRGIVSSRDIGVSLKGRINKDGTVNYWVMIGNNSANKPEADKYKRYYAHLQFEPVKNFQITVYGDLKAKPSIKDPNDAAGKNTLNNNSVTTALFAGYNKKGNYSIGVEGFLQSNMNELQIPNLAGVEVKNRNAIGVSLFGSVYLKNNLAVVGRYDYFDPNNNSSFTGDLRNYFLLAFDFQPAENVSIMPNVQIETYQKPMNGDSIDASVTTRITFFYEFK
ncbi:MAG: hypothetical protein ABI550_01070 [Ignavibacteriaceae bacterium]